MSATQHVKECLSNMKRKKGETDSDFAERKYNMQMEIYSAYAMQDLWKPFFELPKNVQQSWINGVKEN